MFAYDSNLASKNPFAPVLDKSRLAKMEADDLVSEIFSSAEGDPVRQFLVRMPWKDGPCAFILINRYVPPFPGRDRRLFLPIQFWLLPMLSVLVALFLSVGPIVSRVRRLTREVKASKDARYEPKISVKGRDEIAELARAFEEAGQEVRAQIAKQEQRERTLRNFLENTTHDVMIPITVLQGHLSDMADRLDSGTSVDGPLVASAMGETQYISSLIHNLSIAAKIEEGEPALQWEPVNLNELVERVAGRHRPIARQKNVSLDHAVPEEPLWTKGDVTFIEQAVNNVVYNAIRYNRAEGHVAVILEPVGERDFELRVIDDGPGIPEEEISRLVERYFRSNVARSREPQGQGLGLNIAYQLATLHHWKFQLGRSPYGGLQIEFSGPRIALDEAT